LPLGIVSGIQYQTKQVQLLAGSRLTFYSDGVIEAQNAVGELFGFERGQNYSTRPAEEIVKAAEAFGQSDDITVVAVTRTWVGAEAMGEPLFAMQPVGHASEGSGRQSS
jgi:sigma-B regulation protein RsbU (phosphoserine phosphatase)